MTRTPRCGEAAAAPSSAAIGRAQGTLTIDPAGQAVYRIPIEVPPGTAGARPDLALVYAHRQGNGALGVGWALTGQSLITRIRASYAVDQYNGAITYGDGDRLALDGQRLIVTEGRDGASGASYRTELESWQRVQADGDGFRVATRDGQRREYGMTADSRAPGVGDRIRAWALNATVDANGNRVDYRYAQDGGALYLTTITYTSNAGQDAQRAVHLRYEPRPDPLVEFLGGVEIRTNQRLAAIEAALDGATVRSYLLSYRVSAATRLSCLASVQERGADGSALRPTMFTWQDVSTPSFTIDAASELEPHPGKLDLRALSVSGSGRTDVVQLWSDAQGQLNATTYLATPTRDGGVAYQRSSSDVLGTFPAAREVFPVDVDGDGRGDLLIAYRGGNGNLQLAVCLSSGVGFGAPITHDTGDPFDPAKHLQFFAMDVNGDGRTDLVQAYAHRDDAGRELLYLRSYLSTFGGPAPGFGAGLVSATSDPARPVHPLAFWAMDVNGDGMMDLVRLTQRGDDQHVLATAYVSVSAALDDVRFDRVPPVVSDLGLLALPNQIAFLPVDANGDGVQDLLHVWQEQTASGTALHLATFLCDGAARFAAGPDAVFANRTLRLSGFYPMDYNGSGATALASKWISDDDQLWFSVYLPSPSGAYQAGPDIPAGTAGLDVQRATFFACDANGDGKADLLRLTSGERGQPVLVPYTSAGPRPDLLSGITDALGGAIELTYLPLSDSRVYGAEDTAYPRSEARQLPHRMTPAEFPAQAVLGQAIYVVAGYALANAPTINAASYHYEYAMYYAGGGIDLLGRGWLGFGEVRTTDQSSGRVETVRYLQDFPRIGLVSERRVASGATLMTRELRTYRSFTRGHGAAGAPIYESLVTGQRLETYVEGAFDHALGNAYDYDDYGNRTVDTYLGYLDPDSGAPLYADEIVYRRNRYRNDTTPERWHLGLLTDAKTSTRADDPDITKFDDGDLKLELRDHDDAGNLLAVALWDDGHRAFLTTRYTYDAFGNRATETAPGGATTQYEYEATYHTFVQRAIARGADHGPLITAHGFDPRFGVELARQLPDGRIEVHAFDDVGRLTASQGPRLGDGPLDANLCDARVTGAQRDAFLAARVVTLETRTYHDDAGALWSEAQTLESFPTDATRDFVYRRSYVDGANRRYRVVDQSGNPAGDRVVTATFDSGHRELTRTLPSFTSEAARAVTWSYDVLGRKLTQDVPTGLAGATAVRTTWRYDAGEQETQVAADGTADAFARVLVHHAFDGKPRVVRASTPSDGNATTTVRYDRLGRMIEATDPGTTSNPRGVATVTTWDALDRRTRFDCIDLNTTGDPHIAALSYAYDAETGLLAQMVDAAGATTAYRYDALRRPTETRYPDGRVARIAYDDPAARAAGQPSRVTMTRGDGGVDFTKDFVYDACGNRAATTTRLGDGPALISATIFDPQRRVVERTLPGAAGLARRYAYKRVVAQQAGDAGVGYPIEAYTARGDAGTTTYGTAGLQRVAAFDARGVLYREQVGSAAAQVLDASYGYDARTRLVAIDDRVAGLSRYGYRDTRLIAAQAPGTPEQTFEYDASGNLVRNGSATYAYRGHFAYEGRIGDQVVFEATPDACGRTSTQTTGALTRTFAYDGLGGLAAIVDSAGGACTFLNDERGQRLERRDASGSRSITLDDTFELRYAPDGAVALTTYLRDAHGVVAAVTRTPSTNAEQVQYVRCDRKGSTTHIFASDGQLLTRIAYDAFGTSRARDDGAGNGPRDARDEVAPLFEHRELMAGLYDFGARYYAPGLARFLTPDAQLGATNAWDVDALNRYAFELNDPINGVDPTGHAWQDVVGGLIGGALLVVGIAVIVASGGAATPLVAAAAGAFISSGVAAIAYAATHRDASHPFSWGDFGIEVGIGAAAGAISGGAMYGVSAYAATLATTARAMMFGAIGGGLVGSATDTLAQLSTNAALHHRLDDGLDRAAVTGGVLGALAGGIEGGLGPAHAGAGGYHAVPDANRGLLLRLRLAWEAAEPVAKATLTAMLLYGANETSMTALGDGAST